MNDFLALANAETVKLDRIPKHNITDFRLLMIEAVSIKNYRISSFFALKQLDGTFTIFAVLLDPSEHKLKLASCAVGMEYPSITPDAPAFQWFEREIYELHGILPKGHPWLKPLRFHENASGERPLPGDTEYFTMHGHAAHEVAVGPVHAGVIEPGHFRFQCMGEDVFSLEIELGYQHRGIEKLLLNGPDTRTEHFIETASGDTTAASEICYRSIIESMAKIQVDAKAAAMRVLALELERTANHTGDLGALAGDLTFLPTDS